MVCPRQCPCLIEPATTISISVTMPGIAVAIYRKLKSVCKPKFGLWFTHVLHANKYTCSCFCRRRCTGLTISAEDWLLVMQTGSTRWAVARHSH